MIEAFFSFASLVTIAWADQGLMPAVPEQFLVEDHGLAFIGEDGQERERLAHWAANGALSPDSRWLACVEFDRATKRCKLVIRPRNRKDEPIPLRLIWDTPGNGSQFVWAADSKRLLIGENRAGNNGDLEYSYRIYDLENKKLKELKLPDGVWVTGWSRDDKRFLTNYSQDNIVRIAWVQADGMGQPEFLTRENDLAFGARLSPDNQRILFQARPRSAKSESDKPRLYSMDLSTRKRSPVSEPGVIYGYCWSPKGDRVAYTWQPSLVKPMEARSEKTLLLTCDPDGSNRKLITTRKYELPSNNSGSDRQVIFFQVLDWR